jgi:Protein of unknown function (DUF3099)
MRSNSTAITELPPSPDQERRSRVIRYSIAMGIRLICVALLLVVHGWWLIIPVIGAVALPYFAVVIANNVSQRGRQTVSRPGGLARTPAAVAPPPPSGPREDAA